MIKKIAALFAATAGLFGFALTALAAPGVNSAKVTGPNTIVITYSVPVNTGFGDYGNFTNSLSGRTLASLNGNGTGVVTLTFSGQPFAADAHGTLSVASTTVASADGSAYTAGTVTVTDGQAPQLNSFDINIPASVGTTTAPTLPKTGDSVTLTFTTNEAIARPAITIAGHSLYPNGDGTGPYSLTYTLAGGDSQGSVPFNFNLTDLTANTVPISGSLTLNGGSSAPPPTPTTPLATATAAAPVIAQITPIADGATATPTYSFSSTAAGTINFSGDCASGNTSALAGTNSVTFNSLAGGTHNNCVITVTDAAGHTSNTIFIPGFRVGGATAAPAAPAAASTAAPTGDGFKFTKFLKLGVADNEVTELQKRLTAEGLYSGPVTGKFGGQTRAAVKAYQKAHGLDQKGYVGPGTRAALNK